MACRDVWNTWHEAKPEGFVATGGFNGEAGEAGEAGGFCGEAGGFCGDPRPGGHVSHTSQQAMNKTYYCTSIRKNMVQNCSYFAQINQQRRQSTTEIDGRTRLGLAVLGKHHRFLDWISIDILKKLLIFTIATHQNILAKNIAW